MFQRVLDDSKGELPRLQVAVAVAEILGITPLEVGFAVGIKNTYEH